MKHTINTFSLEMNIKGHARIMMFKVDKIKKLHSEYEEARKAAGNGQNGVSFKSFISQLVRQAKSIRETA